MLNFLIHLAIWLFSFVIDFCILYFFGTKDIGLCLSISFIASSLTMGLIRLKTDTSKEILNKLLPSFQQLDGHINTLYDSSRETDEKIQELESKIDDLEFKISDLEDRISEIESPSRYDNL